MTDHHGAARPYPAPPGVALVRPARPRVFALLGWVTLVVFAVGCGLITLQYIRETTGALGFTTGAELAIIPVFPVVATLLWLDRYEAEPASLLALAFIWGGGVATLGALLINSASQQAMRAAGGNPTTTLIVIAPLVEEALKGSAVVVVLLLRRGEFDGVIDGIVYAGMAGIGFAFIENVLYLGEAMSQNGTHGLLQVFVLRCVVSPFAHPLFTAATGIGIGLAVRSRTPAVKVFAPIAGYAAAVSLHSIWNLSATTAQTQGQFWSEYVVFQVPVFIAFGSLAVYARRREGRLIARHLAVYSSTGWLTPAEVAMLASLPARREARNWARRTGGPGAKHAMRDFQELGSELAFLRERMANQTAPADAQQTEYQMLASLSALRSGFLPRWPAPQQAP